MTASSDFASAPEDLPQRLHIALTNLNRIGATINRLGADPDVNVVDVLQLIVDSAVQVIGSDVMPDVNPTNLASAVIYSYDAQGQLFDRTSRVASGQDQQGAVDDYPRLVGLGLKAVHERRRILSYATEDITINPAKSDAGAKVGVCYPLEVAERPVGVLYVYLHEERPFRSLELLMLDNFVNQAAMAIYQAQQLSSVRRDLARKEEELLRLRHADMLISSRLRLEETLETILSMALDVTGARYGILRLADRRNRQLVTSAIAGDDLGRPAVEALPMNATSITGWVAKTRQPLVIHDVRSGKWSRLYYPLDHDLDMRSELAVPLLGAGGRLEGVINLESPHVGAFNEDDSLLLQSLATQAVIAIQEVRLLDALQDIAERLLYEDSAKVLERILELATDLLNADTGFLWTLAGGQLHLQAAIKEAGVPRYEQLIERLLVEAMERRTVVSFDVDTQSLSLRKSAGEGPAGPSIHVVPLFAGWDDTCLGMLCVYISRLPGEGQGSISEWDKKVMTFLAHHAALAVDNARRLAELRSAQDQQAAAETFAAMGDIAANLLHRLNNKIGTIPVRVEGIQDKSWKALAEDEYLAHNIVAIERSAIEALQILRDNLGFLKPIELGPVEVANTVRHAIDQVDLPPGVQVEVEGLDHLPMIIAGRQRLGLVFVNLLENAVTAMQGKGRIRIVGWRDQDWVQLEVEDTGPGIPLDVQDQIFDFNYSGALRATNKLGFGLWWVRTIMARFGGHIRVDSDGKSGTVFRLRLRADGEA